MHFSAKRGIEIACRPSVRLSVCLSVCNVGGSGSHRLEILETNCTDNQPNTFALRSHHHLLPGKNWEILGETRGGVGKVVCWSTKAEIFLKCVKIDEKLIWRDYRNSPTLFRTVPSLTPYGLPFHKIGDSQPQPITAIAINSRTGKATDCKLGRYIQRVHPNKSP